MVEGGVRVDVVLNLGLARISFLAWRRDLARLVRCGFAGRRGPAGREDDWGVLNV